MSLIPLQHKAAGHEGPMQSIDGSLFIKPTTNQEIEFYNKTQIKRMNLNNINFGDSLFDWMPEYVGVLYPGASDDLIRETNCKIDENLLNKATDTLEIEGNNKQYLVLNNCLYGFKNPSIMDIKLGSILYDSNANNEKIKRMINVSKNTTSGSLNFRIAGMIIKNDFNDKLPNDFKDFKLKDVCNSNIEKGYLTFDKYFGRKLTKDNIADGLKIYFRYNKLPKKIQDKIIQNFYVRLQMLYNCLLEEEIRVISGSLFFVYENDLSRWEQRDYKDEIISPMFASDEEDEDGDEEGEVQGEEIDTPLSTLKFIDFAHAKYTPGKGYDEEIILGIENLFKIIETL